MSSLVPARRSRRPARALVLWSDDEIQALIDERRSRNWDYWYGYPGRSRVQFWEIIAGSVNSNCGSNYTGNQCKRKFASLVSEYNVSKLILYIDIFNIKKERD